MWPPGSIKPPGTSQAPALPPRVAHYILNTSPQHNVDDPVRTLNKATAQLTFQEVPAACPVTATGNVICHAKPGTGLGKLSSPQAPGCFIKQDLHTALQKQGGTPALCPGHSLPSLMPTSPLSRTATRVLRGISNYLCRICFWHRMSKTCPCITLKIQFKMTRHWKRSFTKELVHRGITISNKMTDVIE